MQDHQEMPSVPEPSKNESSASQEDVGKSENGQEKEIGGQKGPEPTRYGDWEKGGIASDF